MTAEKGKTASAGFQAGVRRTWSIALEDAWQWLVSPEGMRVWLGADLQDRASEGLAFETKDGVNGEFRVVHERVNVRLRWRKPEWERPSTVQVRVIEAASGRTTFSFHQEQLPDAEAREAMKRHWEAVSADVGRAVEAADA